MLCQDCGQRVSTVVFTEVREGRKETLHLCQNCVAERGIPSPALNDPVHVDQVFRDLLGRLGEEEGSYNGSHPLDAEIHGSEEHLGKAYSHGPDLSREQDMDDLQQDLRAAVEREDFEMAASLRDRIQHMEDGDSGV